MSKNIEGQIKQFLDDNADLFRDLADCIVCPACRKKTRKPFYNLGPKFNSFEGCKKCAEEHNGGGPNDQ